MTFCQGRRLILKKFYPGEAINRFLWRFSNELIFTQRLRVTLRLFLRVISEANQLGRVVEFRHRTRLVQQAVVKAFEGLLISIVILFLVNLRIDDLLQKLLLTLGFLIFGLDFNQFFLQFVGRLLFSLVSFFEEFLF